MPCEAPVLFVLRRRDGPDAVVRSASRDEEAIGWRAVFGVDVEENEECDPAGAFTSTVDCLLLWACRVHVCIV